MDPRAEDALRGDEAAPPTRRGRGAVIERVSTALGIGGGALMLALAVLVTVSVLMRWLTSDGIGGDFELVQTGLALAVFAFLPVCQLRGANIMVDTFTGRAPARLRRGLDAFWALLYALAAALIGWQLAKGAADTIVSETTSMVLRLPTGWAIGACALLAGWLAVVALATAVRALRGAGPAR